MNINLKKQNGVTLLTIIITIIVIVILAGIVIAVAIKDDGIVSKADLAKIKQEEAGIVETVSTYYSYSEDGNGIDIAKTHENLKKMDNAKLDSEELPDGATSFIVKIKGKYKEYAYLIENGAPQNVELFEFAIKANFEDAIIKINGEEISTVKALSGEKLNWSVSKEGYITQSGTYTMGNYPHTMDITLVQPIFKINTTQTGLTIKINDKERNSLQAPVGTVINWSVEKEGFEPQSGTYTLVESDCTKSITLREYFTFTVNVLSPKEATVTIDGETKTSCIVADGDSTTYKVTASGYNTKSETVTITGNKTIDIKLTKTSSKAYLTSCSMYSSLCKGGSYTRSMSSTQANSYEYTGWGYGDFDRSVLSAIKGEVATVKLTATAKNSTGSGTERYEFLIYSGEYNTSGGSSGCLGTAWNNIRKSESTSTDSFTNITMDEVNNGIYIYMRTKVKRTVYGMGTVPSRTLKLSGIYLTVDYYPAEDVALWP